MSDMLVNLIAELRSVEHGQLIDKSRVVDHLLDLRLAAEGDPVMIAELDQLLVDAPGLTMIETTWWESTLTDLAAKADRQLAY